LADFALDYGILHSARQDLHDLADRIGPTLKDSVYAQLGRGDYGNAEDIFGNSELTASFRSLYRLSKDPMNRAEKNLRQLGDIFGSVADAYFDVDAQIADGMGVMGTEMGLDSWRSKKSAWDYRQAHAGECVPDANGKMPDFCQAADPGAPPVDQTIQTGDGTVHTHLTLDGNNNVIKEETTVTHNGQTYGSVTTYADDHRSYVTDTTYADGTKNHADVHINADGTGTMTVTDNDGKKSDYTRGGSGQEWKQVGGDPSSGGSGGSDGSGDVVPFIST
jgi:hypothetical protein